MKTFPVLECVCGGSAVISLGLMLELIALWCQQAYVWQLVLTGKLPDLTFSQVLIYIGIASMVAGFVSVMVGLYMDGK